MNKNNKPIIAAIIIVALLIIIGAVFASGILAHDDDEQAAYEVNFIDGEQVIKTITVKENHLVTRINDPVKEGYIFAGWYTDQELTNEFTFDDTYITNDLTLYAKWVKASEPEPGDITYTVTFNTNGANSISPQIVKAGDKAVKPADPLKSGYKFVGWYSDSSFTTLFDFQSPITFDITLYAKFTSTGGGGGSVTPPVTDTKFTVTFETNGGTSVLPQSVVKGALATEPTAPTKEGYTFAGWYAEGSSIKFDFNTPITSDLTLSAKWSIEYTTSDSQATVELPTDSNVAQEQIEQLVSNGKIELVNTSANEEVNEVIISSEVLGQVQKAQSDLEKKKDVVVTTAQGSIALSSNVVDRLISTAQSSTGNQQDTSDISIKITADEKPNTYQITITTNDNKPVTQFSEPIVISLPYTLQEGENPLDIAVYYIDEKGKETLVHGTYNGITKCVDITTNHLSTYEIKNTAQYAVIFDSNGGTLSIEDLSKYSQFGLPIEKPADPIRAGYNFVDWFKDKDCTQAWNFDSDTVRGESYEITLYAKWTPISYDITYNLDDGVNNPNNPASYTIESDTITLQSPTKTGHTFLGWFDEKGHKVTSIVKGSTGNLQLTAKWEIKQYTVTLASGENYTLTPTNGASTVSHGHDFSFEVIADSSLNLAVKANGQTIKPDANGDYTITNITEDQIVTVEGVSAETYEAIFANSTGIYDVDNTNAINKGADYTFTISLNDAYSQSEPTLQIFGTYASFTEDSQSGNDYTYTISKVESDLVILVNGLQKNTYAVTFISNGEEILKQSVIHGESASLISNLTRPGYEFKGWFLDKEGTNQYTNQSITADTTLYASWSAGSSNYFIYIYQEKIQYSSEANKYELINVEQLSEIIGTTVSIDPDKYQTDEILFDRDGFKLNDEMSIIEGKVASESPLVLSLYFDRKEFTITFLAQNGSSLVTDKSEVAQITAKYGQPVYPVRVVLPNNIILDYWHEANTDTPYLFSTMPAKDLDLYAKYLDVYTLSYDANGGTGEIPFAVQYQEGTEVILFGPGYPTEGSYPLTKEGYTFDGWEYDGKTYKPGETLKITGTDVKLFAKWTPVRYTITFESNGGSAVAAIDANYGTKITEPTTPTKEGHTFAGWYKDAEFTQAWDFAADTVPIDGITLYAKWTADKHTITFESNGGSKVDSIIADYGTIISKPTDPIKAGYTFVGWFTEEALQTEYSFSTMPAENLTLYAKWDINTYQVTFHPNNIDKDSTVSVTYGSLINEPSISAKKGYTLEGWCTDALLTNKWDFTTNTMPAENIDLYAKWTLDTYTLKFYNGTESVDSIKYTIETKSMDLPKISQEGYTFTGWFEKGSSSAFFYSPGVTIGDKDLYANLKINHYTITFDSNGGSNAGSVTQDYDTALGPLPTPTYEGHTFLGWFEDNGTFSKEFTATTMPAGDITIYAKWEAISYTIDFYNDRELVKSVEYSVESDSIEMPDVSKEGYTFDGWYLAAAIKPFEYVKGTTTGDFDLHARFIINQYTISFESNGGSAVEPIIEYYSVSPNLPVPEYEGHNFLGWFEDNGTFSKEFTAETTMPAKDITLYAKWDLNTYKLTINYVYEDGSSASDSRSIDLDYNSSYSVESPPELNGYFPDLSVVSGTLTKDTTITVTYGAYVASVGEKNYRTLEDALNNAVAGDKVILLRDYTLRQDVTVPKDVFLVLPCAADDQGYDLIAPYSSTNHNPNGTTKTTTDTSILSSLYLELTVPAHLTITVDGQLLVNAVTGRDANGDYDHDITGGYAQIVLEGKMTVNDGAILEVCGYIVGSGEITAKTGSEVRDLYVVRNWRGGSQAEHVSISPEELDIYPYNEYDCHNIKVNLKVEAGASLVAVVKMHANGIYYYTRFPQIDNANGLIRLNDGSYLVRSYDPSFNNGEGRSYYDLYGGATIDQSTLFIVIIELSTSMYTYPVDGDITFRLHDGDYVVKNDFKFLTGAEVIVDNASLTVSKGATVVFYDVFKDIDNTGTSEYPDRSPAILSMGDNSTLNIYGSFAGIINMEGKSGTVTINSTNAESMSVTTAEANGYIGDPPGVYLDFKTKYQYTISFNSNGGSEQSPIKYFAGDEIELPTPERLGYDFQGWYLDTALTQLCNPDDITSGNITLYVKWDLSKYTVSFVSNGGSSVADQTINHNEAAEKPNDPTRSGFKFIAWYADQELTEVYDFTTSITGKTTLYAKWEAIEYTISFVTNNEETLEAVKYTTADNSIVIKELSKTGYDFQGWYLDEDLTSLFTFKQYETVGNLTLYAKWSPTAYTIKYYDGTQQLNLAPNGYSIEETVTLPTPEKTGYVFAGWHEKSDLSDEAVFTISEGTSGNKSYYASWTAEPFAITYFDGSNTLSLSPNTYTILENVVLPTPAKDGYTFGGWYNNADCTGNKITSIPIGSSGAKVFYAKFTVNQYTISFNSNGGSAVGNITADYGTNIDEPTAPAKTGYTFDGWFKDVELTQTWDFAADTVPVNGTTLYAKWTLEIYTIDFYNDRELVKSVEYSVESDSIEMPEIPQEGYTFDGWLTNDLVAFKYVKGTTVGDLDLYAKFIINQYTISFNSNDGSVVKKITADYGTNITKPGDPTRTGYTFAGWFKDADGLTAWNFEVDTVPADDITLYAKWIANSYTVVFHANNGTDATTSQNFKYDEAQNLTANTFTKEGYTFLGWSESSSGVVVKYADKISVTNLTADDNETINLYAVWNAQIFSVIYNNNGGEGSIENTSATYDSTVVLNNGANFSKEGHSLTAWNTMADGLGTEYALDYKFEPWKLTDNLTLYAQWTVNSSTISFNSNGGSAVEEITANYGTTIAAPIAPEKEGHTFVGWYTDEALKNEYTFTTMPAESITLYANWTVNQYTVTYYMDGGKYQSYDIDYGEAVTKPTDPTKTGYTFKNWDAEIPATMPAENLTFNAVFDINQHTITYWIDNEKVETQTYDFGATITAYQPDSTEGKTFSGWSPELPETMPDQDLFVSGSFNANTYTITYYVDEKQYDTPQSVEFGETITPMDQPTKEGHTFSNWVWYKVEGGSETKLEAAPATMPAYHLVVRGSFTINTYKVTFHPNNVDKDSTVPVDYGSLIDVPSISAKKGYTLEGWYTDVNLTNKWDFTTNTMPAKDIDLYANWTLDTYTIKFYIGDELFKSIEYTIETESIEIPKISQEGYTFTGWWLEKDSSTEFFYSHGVTVGNIEVYAGLDINHYAITFNSNGGSNAGSVIQDYDTPLGPLPTPTYDGYKFMGWFEDNGTFSKEFTATKMPAGDITLYAKWEAISYSITYVLNDGTNDPANPTSYTVETATITLQDATKEGYTFVGWYSDKKLTELVSQIPTGTPGNLTFYAKFTPNKYTVIFNANGGTGTMETQEFTYDEAQNLTANTFTKEGYTFQGWSESSGGDVKYADKLSVTNLTADNNGTINLYAVWQINQYTISFNSNGGSAVDKITANYGTAIAAPTAPEKEGHTFAGWYTDEALKNEYTFTTMPAESITLYAKWTANQYTITFNSNGGTEVAAINADYGTKITKPVDPTLAGHKFAGWFKDDGTFQNEWNFNIDTVPVNGTTLHAKWTAEEYTITFNSNGAGAIGEIHYTIGATIELQTPVKTGYTFIGWYNGNQEFTYVAGTTIGDYNLTAHWEATNYAIIYKDGENTISGLQPASYTYEAAKTLATNATKEGYTFGGWYETIDCMGAQVTEIPAQSVGDKTFYAKFTPNKYTVIFNANGGTGTMEDQKFTYDVAQNLAPNTFTKEGYTFQGWSNPDTEANYTNTQNVTNLAPSGSITLYAVWGPTSYSISYNLNGGSVSSDNPLNYTIESDTITLTNPTQVGYTFVGWTGTGIAKAQMTVEIAKGSIGNREYTANWTANNYTVHFEGNGATSGSIKDQKFVYGEEQALTENSFVKDGHTFVGWSETAEGSKKYDNQQAVVNLTSTNGGKVTFYAVWSINHYQVTLPNNELVGVTYTVEVVNGYDPSSIAYGGDFKFTITFSGSLGSNNPVIVFGDSNINASSSTGNTYNFTIPAVTSNLQLSVSLVNNSTAALEELVNNDASVNYHLSLSGTTLTVSIINPKADAADLISKISEATGEQSIAANKDSGRADAASTFLAYLPNDDALWADNLAEYVVELSGYRIIFKQDSEAIEEAKIQYLMEIAQAVRVFRENPEYYPFVGALPETLSVSAGLEYDADGNSYKFIDIAVLLTSSEIYAAMSDSGDPNIQIMQALMSNYSTVVALVGHKDAKYASFDLDHDFTKNKVQLGKDLTDMSQILALYNDALAILKAMEIPINTISDPLASCFDSNGNGYGGYGEYYSISSETGIRYTDVYNLRFSNHYSDGKSAPVLHNISISEELLNVISLQNFKTNNDLVYIPFDFSGRENFDSTMINNIYNYEYQQLVSGELIVINTPGYDRSNLSVTTNGNEVTWYNDHAFIMPEGDVTISLKTASTAETPVISAQPQSLNLSSGESAELSITATVTDGGNLSYVWYKGLSATDNLAEESKKIGTAQTYAIPTNLSVGNHYYFCVVTNTLDGTSAAVTSDIVTVQISNKTYSITFNTNGGSVVDNTAYANLQEGAALSLPSSEKFGYLLEGWYTNTALTTAAPSAMPAKNLTLYAKWNNVLSPDGTVTEFENVGDKAWTYDEQTGAYHSEYEGTSGEADYSTTLPEFSVTLTSSGILSFDYLLKSNKAPANLAQDGLGYKFSKISMYAFYQYHLSLPDDPAYLNGSFAVTGDTWGKASIAIDVAEGESVTVYLAYAKIADESTDADGLWIKNLKFSLADLHLTVDVNNAEYGSVTAASGGEPLIGSENILPPSSEVTLTAVPNTGYKFYCWVDENNNILANSAEYTFSLINNMKVTAVFGSEVETQYAAYIGKNFYPTLKAALDDAKAGDSVVLLKDYEMSESATVKAGVSLLLPCMDNDIGYTSKGYNPDGTTATVKALYRTLTIPENVTLTVEGSVLVNAVTGYPAGGNYDQDVRGGYAQINLSGKIIVNNGGLLDNCGYILGSGQVTANAGAEVRDLYVVKHWDGGSHAYGAYNDHIFPFTEYDCHNIQTTLYMESGASLYGTVKMYASSTFNYTRFPQIDNANGLIRLADGAHLIKTYNPDAVNGAANDQGRVLIVIEGGATFSNSTLKIVGLSLSTKSYVYPVDGDIAFVLNNGDYVVENDFKVLPGCTIIVSENSTLTTAADTTVVFYQNTNADGVNNGKGWDTYSNATVRYPAERPDAYLQLSAGSSFTANGSFGGFIQAENASVTLNGGTSCVTKETISTSGSSFLANTEFKEITTTAQLQKSFNGHKILFSFVKEGVTGYQISTAAELPTVQTAGLTFDGWYKGDLKITSLSEISEDAVLTAKWL